MASIISSPYSVLLSTLVTTDKSETKILLEFDLLTVGQGLWPFFGSSLAAHSHELGS